MTGPRIAVVGGGVSGLTAAHRLRTALPDAEIVLLEQTDRLGGKLRTAKLAGREFDLGAEAFLARRPEVLRLADELGIAGEVVNPGDASARVRAGGRIHPLPAGGVMGVPSDPEAVREVLSEDGMAALRGEAALPPLDLRGADVSVGAVLRERVGGEVVDRLVEPLLGGVYAGSADGLEVYFDNVGGDHLEAAMDNLNDFGRVAACGAISQYNNAKPEPGPRNMFQIVKKRLHIQGFIVIDHANLKDQFVDHVAPLVRDGRIHYTETVVEGLRNAPEAFLGLLRGENTGKMLVTV